MAHIHEKIDFTASVLIVQDGKILLHKHKLLNVWLPPGGHIELDEDPNEAAIREAKEETGLDVALVGHGDVRRASETSRDLVPPRFLNRHFFNDTRTHEHIDFGYYARVIGGQIKPEHDTGEVRWFERSEIESMELFEDIRAHVLTALDELVG